MGHPLPFILKLVAPVATDSAATEPRDVAHNSNTRPHETRGKVCARGALTEYWHARGVHTMVLNVYSWRPDYSTCSVDTAVGYVALRPALLHAYLGPHITQGSGKAVEVRVLTRFIFSAPAGHKMLYKFQQ